MRLIRGILLARLALGASASAQPASFHHLLDSVRTRYKLPALGAVAFTRDSIIALDVVGVRKLGDPTPAARDDRFHLGSDTKAMTAGLLGLLVDRGRLRWESTLPELFPELAPTMRPEYRTLSVREILTHRSGIQRNPSRSFTEATSRKDREAFMRWIVKQPLANRRGEYSYANSNYIIAGAIAEKLLDGEFEELLPRELLGPIGITTAGFGAAGSPDKVDQPWGHAASLAGLGPLRSFRPGDAADNPRVFSPAGRLHLSMADWAKWGQIVLRAARGEKSPWTLATGKALVTPAPGDTSAMRYAFGWVVGCRSWATPSGRVLTHSGSNTRNFAVAWLAPERDFGVFVATNVVATGTQDAVDAVAAGALRLFVLPTRGSSARNSAPRAPSPC